jgi:N6-L-threonylcarbamoyladenine synthase
MTASFTILGIETSCDETAAAVVRGAPPGPGEILSNIVASQMEAHRPFGGVVPEIAARAHVEMVDSVIAEALARAGLSLAEIDGVAATSGPGLIGGVMVGLLSGKALALAAGKPLLAVNHLEAHALTARLSGGVVFPYLLLLVSGGHCQLVAVEGPGRYRVLGSTIDDAIGEAFDKTAKLLGLPYPGGPEIEAAAAKGNPKRFALPRPMVGREGADFSFSGLKTAVRQAAMAAGGLDTQGRNDLAASFQAAVLDIVADRLSVAMQKFRTMFGKGDEEGRLVAGGGVAANGPLRGLLERLAARENFRLVLPPRELCTDNAAMVAWAGLERLALGQVDRLDAAPKARWPLESLKENLDFNSLSGSRPEPRERFS